MLYFKMLTDCFDYHILYLENEPRGGMERFAGFSSEKAQKEFMAAVQETLKKKAPEKGFDKPKATDQTVPSESTRDDLVDVQQIADSLQKSSGVVFNNSDGIECIYVGEGDISGLLAESVVKAKGLLRSKFGDKFGEVFKGLKIYYMRDAFAGFGVALLEENAIIMDLDKSAYTLGEMDNLSKEEWLGTIAQEKGENAMFGEPALVYKMGYMFQAKQGDRSLESKKYAKLFLYYCYDIVNENESTQRIKQDIASLLS